MDVRPSAVHGLGLFATHEFAPGQTLRREPWLVATEGAAVSALERAFVAAHPAATRLAVLLLRFLPVAALAANREVALCRGETPYVQQLSLLMARFLNMDPGLVFRQLSFLKAVAIADGGHLYVYAQASYLNHNPDPNVQLERQGTLLLWTARRHIVRGDELTISYGEDLSF